jgi:cytochrome c oxidase subunit 3
VGLWAFLVGEGLLFGTLLAASLFYRYGGVAPWPRPGDALPLALPLLATVTLIVSSACASEAEGSLKRGHPRLARRWVSLTLLLAVVFLGLQAFEWFELFSSGASLTGNTPAVPWERNPWGAPTYVQLLVLATGLHAAHVAAGLGLFVWLLSALPPGPTPRTAAVTLYWHFVDLVWIFILTFLYLL